MESLLTRAKREEINSAPFPYLVIEDALSAPLYQQLLSEYPKLEVITKSSQYTSNQRCNLLTPEIIGNTQISSVWQEFVRFHSSPEFFHQAIGLFTNHIRTIYPDFEKRVGVLDRLQTGLRYVDNYDQADVLVDALICTNTPVINAPSSVRRVHVDLPNKLLVALYYLRDPQDDSLGGDLEICRFKDRSSRYRFNRASIDDRYIAVVDTIKYRANTLVIFINSIDSLHGVTVRSITPFPRYLFNFVAEVKRPLFNLDRYQAVWWQRLKAFAPLS